MSNEISDEEREAGAYRIQHGFGSHNVKGRTLSDLWASEPETLIALHRWRNCKRKCPPTFAALERFLALPWVNQQAAKILIKSQRKSACVRAVRQTSEQASLWGQ